MKWSSDVDVYPAEFPVWPQGLSTLHLGVEKSKEALVSYLNWWTDVLLLAYIDYLARWYSCSGLYVNTESFQMVDLLAACSTP